MPISHVETRSITKAANAWPADSSASDDIPLGIGLASVSFALSGTIAGSTVTGKLQGSIDGTRWEDITDATSGGLAAVHASTACTFGGGSDKLIDLTPYRYIKLVVTETGDMDDGGIMSATVFAQYE